MNLFKNIVTNRIKRGRFILGLIILLSSYVIAGEILYAFSDNRPGYSQDYYQNIIRYFPMQRADALYGRAQFLKGYAMDDTTFVLNNRNGSLGNGKSHKDPVLAEDKDPLNEAKKLFIDLKESFPTYSRAERASYQLGKIYLYEGELEKAKKYAEEFLNTRTGFSLEGHSLMIHIYLELDELQKAKDLYFESIDHPERKPIDSHIGILLGDRLSNLEEYEIANEVYESELKFLDDWHEKYQKERLEIEGNDSYPADLDVYRYKSTLLHRKAGLNNLREDNGATLKGYVAFDGEKKAGVDVYLVRPYHNVRSYEMISKAPSTVTDELGEFEFDNLSPGRYTVAVSKDKDELDGYVKKERDTLFVELDENTSKEQPIEFTSMIDTSEIEITDEGEFTFDWSQERDASYYNFGIGEIFRNEKDELSLIRIRSLKKGITDNELNTDLKELWKLDPGYYSWRNHISKGSVFGLPYPTGEFIPVISAYDEDGNFISNNLGYNMYSDEDRLNIFEVREKFMTEGFDSVNELIESREHIDVINELENSYENVEGYDKEYLLALSRIYKYGTNHYGRNQNLDLSLEYQDKLLELVDNDQLKLNKAQTFYLQGDYKNAKETIYQLLENGLEDEFLVNEVKEYLAKIYLLEGEVNEALDIYKDILDNAKNPDDFKDHNLLAALVLSNSYDEIYELGFQDTNIRDEYLYAVELMTNEQDSKFYKDYFKPAIIKLIESQKGDQDKIRDAREIIQEMSHEYPNKRGELYFLVRLYTDIS
ncbi:carboxypeptidase-like regulatory domain-containing protein [Natranaerobius trueperi]|uniref:Tetratricopeptide repeat protein n=1 Tax=Natranaerobius trueperi TaxID=759412 RepID=A0A226C0T8_9FIRM|nr:carboxypeptidase-like regulatory domain-containing protein [Natranaerobius trueperi]OWZ84918.1 hypothetical protein CDO51_00495 [Natranaerobius trueperi]